MKDNILITGIAGFAGSYLAERLIKSGRYIYGVAYPFEPIRNIEHITDRIGLHYCDLTDFNSTQKVIEEVKPSFIYHLSGMSNVGTSWQNVDGMLRTNYGALMNIFRSLAGLNLYPRVMAVGSGDEYGILREADLPASETLPLNPANPYALSKVFQEYLASFYENAYGFRAIKIRAFNHVGPRQRKGFVCSDIAAQIASAELKKTSPVIKAGNIDSMRNFTDVRDIAEAYFLAFEKNIPADIYNVGSDRVCSIREIIAIMCGLSNLKFDIEVDPGMFRKSDTPVLLGSAAKFIKETGWKAVIPLEKTLADILDYWRKEILVTG